MVINNTKEIIKVPFEKIKINPFNPRHTPMLEEMTAALWLIDDDIKGMIELISSFVECGFLPFPFAVIKESNSDSYVALDGNRRLTALKLLGGILALPDYHKYYQLKDYVEKNKLESTDFMLDCLIYNTEEEAASYIVSIHQSGGSIPGQKKWTPLQQNRYADTHSKKVDDWYLFVKKHLDEKDIETLKQPSTLTRIINNPEFKTKFQVDKNFDCSLDVSKKQKLIAKIVDDLNNGKINSRIINTSKEVIKYISELATYLDIQQSQITNNEPQQLTLEGLPKQSTDQQSNVNNTLQIPNSYVRNFATPRRKTIIPNHINLTCENTKINYLNYDLKRLDIYSYKTTCAIALRVLIELLTKYYLHKNKLRDERKLEEDSSLHSDISFVLNDMRSKNLIADALHHQCIAYINKQERIRFLNGCIHHLDVNPDTENLIEMFDTLEKYLVICSTQ